ncbi:hypothetical protein HJ583_000470 [Uliginosibacterium sp. IMCC34675]|uniref:Uncharacterized protein n=1 Tax=Uliginosibacterium aquaticum TaxID=2731212 RepID=A0ABX2ICU0_9RHOO|nr:hypothetical protein [Uliginosibacterium aquaticum]
MLRFGAPVKARVQQQDNLLVLSPEPPARELAQGAEVILVSGYEPPKGAVHVNIDRPGAKVLLVMTSYEQINWRVTASPKTSIVAILVGGYHPSTVSTTLQTQGYMVKLPYAYETENVKFRELLVRLNQLFGIEQLSAFRGSYTLPAVINLAAPDAPRAELTMQGPQPKVSKSKFTFGLLTRDYGRTHWTVSGPLNGGKDTYVSEGKIAVSESGDRAFRLRGDQLESVDIPTGQATSIALPPDFPRFSWAMDLAYDSKRNVVSIVTLGGEGFLYRFDARNREWLDYRSVNNVDIFSLSYDAKADRYVAWTDQGSLLFISGTGDALFAKPVISRLEGFGRVYDRGNGRPPRLQIAATGDDIALVYIVDGGVRNIWHYNLRTDAAALTYSRN